MTFHQEILNAFAEILKAPFIDLSALWMLIPLFLIWFVLTMYFGTHKQEVLGWNSSLGHGITIFWISVELMRYLFSSNFSFNKFLIILLLLCYSIFICYISFKHVFSAKTTYATASPNVVYYFSGIVILWVYGSLQMNLFVFIDILVIFGLILLTTKLIKKFIPSIEDKGEIVEKETLTDLETSLPDAPENDENTGDKENLF